MAETPTGTTRWESAERWSATAFLAAGALLLGFAVNRGVDAFTAMSASPAVELTSGLLGLLASVAGLLGLYPRLHDRAPRLSLGGVASLVLAVVGILGVVGWLALAGPPEAEGDVPGALTLVFVASVLLIALGFVLFAAASLRTGVPSPTVGRLLLVPVVVWVWHYSVLAVYGSSSLFSFTDYTVISVAFLAVGYLLRSEAVSADSVATADSTA